jgi:hypothetical protein
VVVTVIGLCFGGGQIWFDYRMKQEQHGTLTLTTERDHPPE